MRPIANPFLAHHFYGHFLFFDAVIHDEFRGELPSVGKVLTLQVSIFSVARLSSDPAQRRGLRAGIRRQGGHVFGMDSSRERCTVREYAFDLRLYLP